MIFLRVLPKIFLWPPLLGGPRRSGAPVHCFMDNSPTNQLADNQLADRPTRRQSISPTNQLADNKLADRPTRRQLNWPKKPTHRNWNCHQNRCKIFWTHGRVFLVILPKKKLATRCRCDCCHCQTANFDASHGRNIGSWMVVCSWCDYSSQCTLLILYFLLHLTGWIT